MKNFLKMFCFRGAVAAAGGPVVLAIVYGILGLCGVVESISTAEVCRGILTVTFLAFTVGGVTMIYQVERLPILLAALIHGGVLYVDYLLIYLVNGWLKQGLLPVLVFTLIFVMGYGIIWAVIYGIQRRQTEKLNRKLL